MRLNKLLILLIISCLAFGNCKGPKVVSFTSPKAEFARYETYKIVSPKEGELGSSEALSLNDEIESLIAKEMDTRAYEYAPKGDIRVHYSFITSNQTDFNVSNNQYLTRRQYYNYPYQRFNVRTRNFYEAILLIELKSKSTAKTVWQGSLDLRYSKRIKEKKDVLPNAIRKIFEAYPYVAGSDVPVVPE